MEEDKRKTEHGQKTERGQQGQNEHGKKSLQPNINSMAVKSKGVKTTGHVFDGIEESDRSLPKWWCLVFYISVVIAIIYASLYPSVPTNKTHFKGLLNTTDIQALEKTLELAAAADNAASQSVVIIVLPKGELQESEFDDFFPVVLDLPESPPPFSLLSAKQFC